MQGGEIDTAFCLDEQAEAIVVGKAEISQIFTVAH